MNLHVVFLSQHPQRLPSASPGDDTFTVSFYDQLASASRFDQPVAMLLARDQLDRVLAAMPTLTPKERAALTGDLSGKSHQQLADELATTKKAVALALRRARRKLAVQEALAAYPALHAPHRPARFGSYTFLRSSCSHASHACRRHPRACAWVRRRPPPATAWGHHDRISCWEKRVAARDALAAPFSA